jgi:hypothetical protein
MQTLVAAGYRLPQDQAVIGFDDVEAAAHTTPRLSSVKQSFETLGSAPIATLLEQMRGDATGPRRRQVPTSLVVRESCGYSGPSSPSAGAHEGTSELARAQFNDRAHLEETLDRQYDVSMELLRSHEEDPRLLRWLARSGASAGCLGLWADGRAPTAEGATLEIAGMLVRDGSQCSPPAQMMRVEAFPPAELIASAEQRADALVLVVPVKVGTSDWVCSPSRMRCTSRLGPGARRSTTGAPCSP